MTSDNKITMELVEYNKQLNSKVITSARNYNDRTLIPAGRYRNNYISNILTNLDKAIGKPNLAGTLFEINSDALIKVGTLVSALPTIIISDELKRVLEKITLRGVTMLSTLEVNTILTGVRDMFSRINNLASDKLAVGITYGGGTGNKIAIQPVDHTRCGDVCNNEFLKTLVSIKKSGGKLLYDLDNSIESGETSELVETDTADSIMTTSLRGTTLDYLQRISEKAYGKMKEFDGSNLIRPVSDFQKSMLNDALDVCALIFTPTNNDLPNKEFYGVILEEKDVQDNKITKMEIINMREIIYSDAWNNFNKFGITNVTLLAMISAHFVSWKRKITIGKLTEDKMFKKFITELRKITPIVTMTNIEMIAAFGDKGAEEFKRVVIEQDCNEAETSVNDKKDVTNSDFVWIMTRHRRFLMKIMVSEPCYAIVYKDAESTSAGKISLWPGCKVVLYGNKIGITKNVADGGLIRYMTTKARISDMNLCESKVFYDMVKEDDLKISDLKTALYSSNNKLKPEGDTPIMKLSGDKPTVEELSVIKANEVNMWLNKISSPLQEYVGYLDDIMSDGKVNAAMNWQNSTIAKLINVLGSQVVVNGAFLPEDKDAYWYVLMFCVLIPDAIRSGTMGGTEITSRGIDVQILMDRWLSSHRP